MQNRFQIPVMRASAITNFSKFAKRSSIKVISSYFSHYYIHLHSKHWVCLVCSCGILAFGKRQIAFLSWTPWEKKPNRRFQSIFKILNGFHWWERGDCFQPQVNLRSMSRGNLRIEMTSCRHIILWVIHNSPLNSSSVILNIIRLPPPSAKCPANTNS